MRILQNYRIFAPNPALLLRIKTDQIRGDNAPLPLVIQANGQPVGNKEGKAKQQQGQPYVKAGNLFFFPVHLLVRSILPGRPSRGSRTSNDGVPGAIPHAGQR